MGAETARWRMVIEVEGPREWFGLDRDLAALTTSPSVDTLLAFVGDGSRCVRFEMGRVECPEHLGEERPS